MAEDKAKKKKMVSSESCRAGKHTYMVVDWSTVGGRKKAIHMRCQHCLMPVDLVEVANAKWFEG